MPGVQLKRADKSPAGTFGALIFDGEEICKTCELPWKNNLPEISCIPAGVYPVEPHNSAAHPNTWEVMNVPGRSEILLHTGNFPHAPDTLGCILIGTAIGILNGEKAITGSKQAFIKLRQILPQRFTLTVE